ncbi:MAG TPA: hypothetical protein DEA08_00300 [Planctomycetes bacterium]|nr:hypothetical protein [Planctomycetota bacterium]|tara:strand:+ start:675 stop:1526 length:852 start_codon:yes stop_codon:yes gene_type:complete
MTRRWTAPLLASLALFSGCQVDLRPEELAELSAPRDEAGGRRLLAQAEAAQVGSAAPWKSVTGVRVELRDAYYGLTGSVARPWPEDPAEVVLHFRPGSDDSLAEFQDGEQTLRWGIHDWNTWTQEGAGPREYSDEPDADVAFWLPTLEYFLEMAFRLGEAQFVDLAAPRRVRGELCDVVYLTWGSYGPNDEVDQYVAYVSRETRRLVRVDFTVRDFADFIQGRVLYSDFRQVGGYWLPHLLEIGEDPPEDQLHTITVRAWQVGVPLSDEALKPDPRRRPAQKP